MPLLVLSFWTRTRTRKIWTRNSPDPSPEKNDSNGRSSHSGPENTCPVE